MQLSRCVHTLGAHLFKLAQCTLAAFTLATPSMLLAQEAGTSLYLREDSDGTTVISPRVRVGGDISEQTRLDASYTVDVWSSASIDIRSAATSRIHEQRDEIDVSGSHAFGNATVAASYRYSGENDYQSNGGSLSISHDFADKATNLLALVGLSLDTVGIAGDPIFRETLNTLSSRLALTQVIDTEMLMQLSYDLTVANGFQESPYRRVRLLDGSSSQCTFAGPAIKDTDYDGCRVQEHVPDTRLRHTLALQARRSLASWLSVGAGYRFYIDSWELSSHTLEARTSIRPSDAITVTARYRYYDQGAVSFYQPYYSVDGTQRTNDRELSEMSSQRLGLDGELEFEVGRVSLLAAMAAGLSLYNYANFPGLSAVQAYELGISLSAEL